MKSNKIPTAGLEPDAIVIHCCTKDLRRQEQFKKIACEISNLASSIKIEYSVYQKLKILILGPTIILILNCRGLHLTTKGSKIVMDNIVKRTKNVLFKK